MKKLEINFFSSGMSDVHFASQNASDIAPKRDAEANSTTMENPATRNGNFLVSSIIAYEVLILN